MRVLAFAPRMSRWLQALAALLVAIAPLHADRGVGHVFRGASVNGASKEAPYGEAPSGEAPSGEAPSGEAPYAHAEASRMSMACLYSIDAYGRDANVLRKTLEDAFDEVDRIDRLMSHYRPDSPLSRLNREAAAHAVKVDPELFDVLAESMRYNRDSGGAFDVTVGPLMKAWGFFRGEGRLPSSQQLDEARRHVGASHVVFDRARRTVAFDEAGVELDLGGIAKGYAVDRVVHLLRARGVSAALVSAGGSTIYGLGAPPGRDAWDVAVQNPLGASKRAMTVHLKDRALSIAGTSEKWFEVEGVRYSHIMDPRTGMPVQGILSVAVLTRTGTGGDALDDAFFVLGVQKSRAYVRRLTATEAYFFVPDAANGWHVEHIPPHVP
jgi:FAD:protein FMN transferase